MRRLVTADRQPVMTKHHWLVIGLVSGCAAGTSLERSATLAAEKDFGCGGVVVGKAATNHSSEVDGNYTCERGTCTRTGNAPPTSTGEDFIATGCGKQAAYTCEYDGKGFDTIACRRLRPEESCLSYDDAKSCASEPACRWDALDGGRGFCLAANPGT
jgi:hypothetical protein